MARINHIPRKPVGRLVRPGQYVMSAIRTRLPAYPGPGLYVNPEFTGGGPSGPIDGANPPDGHTLGFNTVNSRPDGPGRWRFNEEEATGRSFFNYSVGTNHPDLQVGETIEIGWTLYNLSEPGTTFISQAGGSQVGCEVLFPRVGVPALSARVVSAFVTIADPVYECIIRVGVGPTTDAANHALLTQAYARMVT